ncbi:MAG: hypothetical protein RLZZ127_79 [Planctomycetota bacterium]
MSDDPATIILSGADWEAWQAGRRGQARAGAQRLAIDTGRQHWRILAPGGRIVDEGVVTRGCNP